MRVTQVSTWRTQCGIADYTGHLVDGLTEVGVEANVAEIDRQVTRYLSKAELRDYFDRLAEQAAQSDLVHIQHEFSFFAGAYSWGTSLGNLRRFLRRLRRLRKPTVVTFHTDPQWFVRRNDLILDQALQIGARAVWRAAMPSHFAGHGKARVVAHSRMTRRHLIDAGLSAEAIEVVPQGIPSSPAADASREDRAAARAWLGLPRDAIVLGMFGFVAGYKGYEVALDALRRLPEQYHLLVVGGRHPLNQTPDLDPVLDAADETDLAGRLTLTGFVSPEERDACLTATDICLAPYTGYPVVSSSAAITWALASGRPVIASDIPTFREISEEEDCLELVAPRSPAELALAVETLSLDRDRQQALTDAARDFAAAHGWARVAERHAEIYRSLASPASRSAPKPSARPAIAQLNGRVGQATLPPAPARMLRRPQFEAVPLDEGEHFFWLAHDGDPLDILIPRLAKMRFTHDANWQLVRHLIAARLSRDQAMVVDLGAHLGTFALPLATLGARVLAVDASPRNVQLLKASALRNRFENLEVVHAAAGASTGGTFFRPHGAQGFVLAAGAAAPDGEAVLEVPAELVDDLLESRGWPEVALVKLDVEGSELAALRGMAKLLASDSAPVLVIECNPAALGRQGASYRAVLAEIEAHGYRALAIDDAEVGRLSPVSSAVPFPAHLDLIDVLAVKPQHQIDPPWREDPYDELDRAGRLASQASSEDPRDRILASRGIQQAPVDVRRLPGVHEAALRLARDKDPRVRLAISDAHVPELGTRQAVVLNGRAVPDADASANGHARVPFRAGGRPAFGLLTYAEGHGGYGYSGEELMLAAAASGVDVVWAPIGLTDDGHFAPATRAFQSVQRVKEREVLVIYSSPYDWPALSAPITLGMTMWETSELPDSWLPALRGTRGLMVPSEFCRRVFAEKVDLPIEVVPLGVNPTLFPELERPERDIFTFLMVSTLSGRKGPDIALRAFEAEFDSREPVRLVLKTRGGILDWRGRPPRDERVLVFDQDLERHQMLWLYGEADCLVACSRGEASGLTPREAMSTGIPAIVTDWGGLQEIANPDCNFVLGIDGEESALGPIYPITASGGSSIGRLATPSVEHLRTLMRAAYEDRARTRAMGERAAAWIRSEWTYARCAEKWVEAIARLVELEQANGHGRP